MKARDRYLTGFLLILIGTLIGTILTLYQQGMWVNDNAQVKFTEIKRNGEPVYSDKELESIDARFLFKTVAEEVTPTVVYIETIIPVDRSDMPGDENHNRGRDFWDRFLPPQARTVGSGVLITSDGYILTNNHVIDEAVNNGIRVVLNDKRVFKARVVGTDSSTDLAVIKIDALDLPSIVIGNSDKVDVGEWVLAIGNPFRLRSTVTAGIVSALGRDVQIINDQMRIESFIQTDAAINKGNSGGALVNTGGELIGINTAIASQSGNYQGYGFAVPANLAIKVAQDIIEFGEVRRALLGVTIQGVDYSLAEELGMNSIHGVVITEIIDGGAADKFGLKLKDVVLAVDEKAVDESNELQEKIAVMRPGEIVKLKIWRNGEILNLNVKLGLLDSGSGEFFANSLEIFPEEEKQNNEFGNGVEFGTFSLGFKVMALSKPEDAGRYDLIITEIEHNSEASRRGLKEGYQIRKINDTKVEDLKTLKDLVGQSLKKRGAVILQVETEDGAVGYFELKQ